MNEVWKVGALRIIYYITKFIRQIKMHTSKIKFKLLNKKILTFIDDSAADMREIQLLIMAQNLSNIVRGVCSRFKGTIEKARAKNKAYDLFYETQRFISKKIPVITPDSTFKILWDVVVVFIIVVNIFYIPMKLSFSFDTKDNEVNQLLLETIPSWIFVADILLNFNTAYYSKGVMHRNKRDIFKHYVKGNFWWDMIVVIPFILSQFRIPYTEFTLLLRVTRVRSMMENVEEILNFRENIQAVVELLKSVYFIIFVSHFCACAWHYIGEIQVSHYKQDNSWLLFYGIYEETWQTKYTYSFYFSTITTLTVGYGDIGPVTNLERVFVVIVALIICGVFGYTVSSIGEIFK